MSAAGERTMTTDGTGLAERLMEVCAGLGTDELRMLLLVAERLAKGPAWYGTLLIAMDGRCFQIEALKATADGVYVPAALMRRRVGRE